MKKKEVNKRKTFLSILYLHQYMMFKTHKEIRGVNASIFDWASCGIRYYEGLVNAANGTYCLCALTDELIQHCSFIFQHKKKKTQCSKKTFAPFSLAPVPDAELSTLLFGWRFFITCPRAHLVRWSCTGHSFRWLRQCYCWLLLLFPHRRPHWLTRCNAHAVIWYP